MKRLLLCAAASLTAVLSTAQCDGIRFFNQVFNDYTEIENIVYGENINYQGATTELLLDVYQPVGDIETARPLIVMVHGGSFIGGSKDGVDVTSLASDFTKMGYVVASINYRLGLPITLDLETPATEAVVRGYHDAKAAVRFFRKDIAESGNTYNINTDEIYMTGVSAGGFVALHVAYMDELSEMPAVIDQTLPGLGGGLEGTSGNDGYSSDVKGIVNIAGAIGDTTWIQPNDEPILSFHGTGDTVVPFDSDMLQIFGFDVLEVDGSSSVHERANNVGLFNCFEVYEGQGHVPHVDNAAYYDTTRSIMSSFIGSLVCPFSEMDCEYREVELDVDQLTINDIVQVFPNPASTQLTIRASAFQNENALAQVFNISGQLVKTFTLNSGEAQVNVEELASGVYVIQINGEERIFSERIVIE